MLEVGGLRFAASSRRFRSRLRLRKFEMSGLGTQATTSCPSSQTSIVLTSQTSIFPILLSTLPPLTSNVTFPLNLNLGLNLFSCLHHPVSHL